MVAGTIAISSAGLSFLMFLFLAKALGAEEYGRFAPMFSLGSFLAFVALLGQQTRVLKRLPGWIDAAEFGSANQLLRQALIVVMDCFYVICFFLLRTYRDWRSVPVF